jgi:hypothetical protein
MRHLIFWVFVGVAVRVLSPYAAEIIHRFTH